jgi:hypothetical protein
MFHVKRRLVQENETRIVPSELFGPFSGGVEDAQDFDGLVAHAIGNDVWRSAYHQLASAGDAAGTARGWMGG